MKKVIALAVLCAATVNAELSDVEHAQGAGPAATVAIDGKVVLANVERHPATIRLGTITKEVAAKKASVLSPKKYPITVQIWSGAKTGVNWQRQSIFSAGVYLLHYQNGVWRISKQPPRSNQPSGNSSRLGRSTYRRMTGSAPRVVRGSWRPRYYGPRMHLLGHVAGRYLWIHRCLGNDLDRELFRRIMIGEEIDDQIEREFWDRLDDMAVNLPSYERNEFQRALDDLQNLNESDWQDIEDASATDWNQAREYLGDQVSDNAWEEVQQDLGSFDMDGDSAPADAQLEQVGIDSLESNVDIADLAGDNANFGGAVAGGMLDSIDAGAISGGIEDIYIGDLGADFAGGYGAGGFGGQVPVAVDHGFQQGRAGAGFDAANGGFDGGGFQYDGGGFDDFGAGFDGGVFDGGGFDGGGFDGGGFDDFGGGFDDF